MAKYSAGLFIGVLLSFLLILGCDTTSDSGDGSGDGATAPADPVFDPAAGTYDQGVDVTISCATEGALIYYTTDETDPTTSGTAVQGSSLQVTETTTVKAAAKTTSDGSDTWSNVVTAVYVISGTGVEVVAGGFYFDDDDLPDGFYLEVLLREDGSISDRAAPEPVVLEDDVDSFVYGIVETEDSIIATGLYLNTETNKFVPCIWEDGVKTDLPVPDRDPPGSGYATCVAAGSVYVGGRVTNEEGYINACGWSDGTLNLLEDFPEGTTYSSVNDVAYDGTNLILAGSCTDYDYGNKTLHTWKIEDGDIRSDLPVPEGVTYGDVGGLFLDGSDVYVCGFYQVGEEQTACYWKNGERTDIETGEVVRLNAIAVNNGDIFVAGWTAEWSSEAMQMNQRVLPENRRACVWKNGTRTYLSTDESYASDLKVYGDDVVVAGYCGESPEQYGAFWLLPDYAATAAAASRDGNDVNVVELFLSGLLRCEVTAID